MLARRRIKDEGDDEKDDGYDVEECDWFNKYNMMIVMMMLKFNCSSVMSRHEETTHQ